MGVTRYRAVLAYDGTGYHGFQRQAGDTPTIQGAVEAALARVTGQPVTITGAGRTDTGVHATGQVIAFDVAWKHAVQDLWRAVNANLPDGIALQTLDKTGAEFHPRYDARSRAYEYTLYTAPVRQPLVDRYAWFVAGRGLLDIDGMQAAAASLIGRHDFATFGRPPQGDNSVRCVQRSEIKAMPGQAPGEQRFRYTIEADAFLYRMVRRIVGALVRVGRRKLSVQEFEAVFRAADGAWPNQTAPARGLCLVKVTY